MFSIDTDILLSVDKTKRLTGLEAHKIIRDVLIRGRVSEIKLLPTIESLTEHRLRAQNVFRLWDSAVTGSKAALPAHIDNGYSLTSLKPNTEPFMMMNLGKGYYYGGKPYANLHFVKPRISVVQVASIPIVTAASNVNGVEIGQDGDGLPSTKKRPKTWEETTIPILKNIIKSKGKVVGLTQTGKKQDLIDRLKR